MGAVELSVSDLATSLDYYRTVIGLETLEAGNGRASLGVSGRELLVLVEEPGARSARGHTGLFHFALLVPQRADLARWLAHAARDRVRLEGLSDHNVSEAIYLRDPDSHGIEIYADRPRSIWEGQVAGRMTTLPLDVDNLLGLLDDPGTEPFDGLEAGTVMGHVHLCVASIAGHDRLLPRRRRLRADGATRQPGGVPQRGRISPPPRRQHLGERGRLPAPPGTARLLHATIVLPDSAERDRLVARLETAGHPVSGDGCGSGRGRPVRKPARPHTRLIAAHRLDQVRFVS